MEGDGLKSINPLISIKNISMNFGSNHVLHNINLDINKGEVFGIIGVSGAGKTTFLELLIGFHRPDSGEILLSHEMLDELKDSKSVSIFDSTSVVRRAFGFATQKPSFYDELTVEENLKYFGTLYDLKPGMLKKNISSCLDLVGLKDKRKVLARKLSGGMRKRLDIACALIHNPSVLLLDEPTSDLDIMLRKQMWSVIRNIRENGTTVVIASHFLDEMEELCDRIAMLHNMEVSHVGKLDDLKNFYTKHEEIHLETYPGDYAKIVEMLRKHNIRIERVMKKGNKLVLQSSKASKVLHYILHILEHSNETLIDVDLMKPSLNEVFEAFIRNN